MTLWHTKFSIDNTIGWNKFNGGITPDTGLNENQQLILGCIELPSVFGRLGGRELIAKPT
jgi:hypothetical protein